MAERCGAETTHAVVVTELIQDALRVNGIARRGEAEANAECKSEGSNTFHHFHGRSFSGLSCVS